MTRTIAAVLAACTLAAAGTASAQEVRIAYGDLDLATTAGAATFDARVQKAARSFCRESHGATTRISDRAACERAVREEAMSQLPEYAQVRYAVSRLPVTA